MDTTTALYNFSPLLQLLLMGALVALGPLGWLWLRHRRAEPVRRLHALMVLTLFLTFDLVVFGAFTRLTDSGLGCPDWPGCYGHASPVGAQAHIDAAQSAMPTGPVTHGKAWVEMVHRYLATGVGALIVVMTVLAWSGRGAAVSPWWPTGTLLWVCLQGAFGALTVTMRLFPAVVTLHLAGGIVLLVLLCIQAVRQDQAASGTAVAPMGSGVRTATWLVAALLALQILLGGWVSTNYAVLACTQFPRCQGRWWPAMDFLQGFQLWRGLGVLQDGSHISFAALAAIHYTHRLVAYALLVALGWLAWRLAKMPSLRRQARWLAGLTLCQFATGLSNVVLGWPLVAAVMHTAGAAALAATLAWVLSASRAGSASTLPQNAALPLREVAP